MLKPLLNAPSFFQVMRFNFFAIRARQVSQLYSVNGESSSKRVGLRCGRDLANLRQKINKKKSDGALDPPLGCAFNRFGI